MARWNDWREAVSSGGTEPRSRVGGAPGGPPGVEEGGGGRAGCMAVGICCGWGRVWVAAMAGCGCWGTIITIMGLYGRIPGGYGDKWGGWGMRWWCDRCEEAWLCSLGAAEPWPRLRLLRVEYSDSLPLPERESAPPSPAAEGDLSPPPTVLPGPLAVRRRSPSLLVDPLLRLPKERKTFP